MHRAVHHGLWACSLALLAASPAHAGRPMATEDAEVIDDGDCELESFGGRFGARGEPASRIGSAQVGCGIGGGSQVALAVARSGPKGAPIRALALGGKTRLWHSQVSQTSWALAWGLTAERGDGHGLRQESSYLTAVVTRPLNDELNLHANLGWSHARSSRQSTLGWSIGLEQAVSDRLDLTLESFGSDREHAPWLQTGLRWAVAPDKFYVDTSLGRQTGASGASAFTIGLRLAF
jgi:hypothetical protein